MIKIDTPSKDEIYLTAYPKNENKSFLSRFDYCIIYWKTDSIGRVANVDSFGGMKLYKLPFVINIEIIENNLYRIISDNPNYLANKFKLNK